MPDRHFRFDDEGITEDIVDGRRPSADFTAIPPSKRRLLLRECLQFVEESGGHTDRQVATRRRGSVNGQLVLNAGGQQNCALVASCSARWWP